MTVDLQTLTSATQLLFLAYVASLSSGLASRTTIVLAVKLLHFAAVLAEGHVAALSRIPRIYGPYRGQTWRKVVADFVVLIVNLYYIHRFLEQLLQESPASWETTRQEQIEAAAAVPYPLMAAVWFSWVLATSFRWLLFFLRWTRVADIRALYLTCDWLSALIDVAFYQVIAMNAYTGLREILVAVLPSANIPEGTMDESDVLIHLDWISEQELRLGFALYKFLLSEEALQLIDIMAQ